MSADSEGQEPSLLRLFNALLKRWSLVVGVSATAAVGTAAISLIVPAKYTATTSFVPEAPPQPRLPTGLASLAGQLGASFTTEGSRSPRFYADVIKSREMLERVLLSSFTDPRRTETSPDSVRLLSILRVNGRTRNDSLERGVRALLRLVSVKVDNQTNIVRVSVETRYPALSAGIANRLVEYLSEFNTSYRQSQARQRRKFVELRATETERALRQAEDDLKTFYDHNRSWQQAPQLQFEEGRLRRQLDIRQEIYLTLSREYETARVEEVNDTPVLTVLDPAVPPQQRSSPRRTALTMAAVVLGLMIGAALALGADYVDQMRDQNRDDYLEFKGLLGRIRAQLRRVAPSVKRSP